MVVITYIVRGVNSAPQGGKKMTIDEAIKELGETTSDWPEGSKSSFYYAIQLGIEALKEVRRHRRPTNLAVIGLLPGEMEE